MITALIVYLITSILLFILSMFVLHTNRIFRMNDLVWIAGLCLAWPYWFCVLGYYYLNKGKK
jgi:uncharacterized RDD family membrane protein YckC